MLSYLFSGPVTGFQLFRMSLPFSDLLFSLFRLLCTLLNLGLLTPKSSSYTVRDRDSNSDFTSMDRGGRCCIGQLHVAHNTPKSE